MNATNDSETAISGRPNRPSRSKYPRRGRVKPPTDPRQASLALTTGGAVQLVEVPAAPAETAAAYDDAARIKRMITTQIRHTPYSRDEIAERMTTLTGRPVTKPMLDAWTGSARTNAMPLHMLRPFLLACGATSDASAAFVRDLLDGTGYRPMHTAEAYLARIGQLVAASHWVEQRIKSEIAQAPLFGGAVA